MSEVKRRYDLRDQFGPLIDGYVLDSDHEAEVERLTKERDEARVALYEEREMSRRRQYPAPYRIGNVYTRRDGLIFLLPIVNQWAEYPDIAIEVGWSPVLNKKVKP